MVRIRRWDGPLILAVSIYLAAGLLLLGHFRYQINPDAISYISIAQHYRDGFWLSAINAYWSPLYSWLLLPFLVLRIDPLLAAKIVNLIIGAFVLAGTWRLGEVAGLSVPSRRVLLFVLAPVVLQWAYSVVTPDLLTLALLLAFLTVILRPDFMEKPKLPLLAGALAGLAYLSKAYALPFAIVIFVICALWQTLAFGTLMKTALRQTLWFALALGSLALPWIAIISLTYHRFTLGTSARFNLALIGPHTFWYPMLTRGLFAPPNEHALSSWEDPTFLPLRIWSPFSSIAHFTFWLQKIVSNWGDLCRMLNEFSVLALPAIGLAAFFALRKLREGPNRYEPILALLISVLVLAGGYTLVFLERRYIWLCAIGLLIFGLYSIQSWRSGRRFTNPWTLIMTALLSLSFIAPAVIWLGKNLDVDRSYLTAAQRLPVMRGGNFASNDMTGLYFAYYKDAKFYGLPRGSAEEIAEQLRHFRVDYFFLLGPGAEPFFVKGAERIDSGDIKDFRVYKLPPHPL